mgnify:CR=1 FL=1
MEQALLLEPRYFTCTSCCPSSLQLPLQIVSPAPSLLVALIGAGLSYFV